jgi:hypothetical protein
MMLFRLITAAVMAWLVATKLSPWSPHPNTTIRVAQLVALGVEGLAAVLWIMPSTAVLAAVVTMAFGLATLAAGIAMKWSGLDLTDCGCFGTRHAPVWVHATISLAMVLVGSAYLWKRLSLAPSKSTADRR